MVGDPLRQPDHTAARGDQVALDFRQPELGVFRGDDQVAAESQFEPAAHGEPFDGGDQRLGQLGFGQAAESASRDLRRLALERGFEVHTGAEGVLGAGQDTCPERGVALEFVERGGQSGRDGGVDRVAGLRPVDRDQQGAADPLGAYFTHDFTS